jgi:carboxymethylenebutenolidase
VYAAGSERPEATLKDAKANYELFRYDAQHGFFNEQRPEVYNAEASQQAWTRMLGFLTNICNRWWRNV